MTVLHENTAGSTRSNRFGKFMVGTAMVVVGIGAAFGISQLIDETGTGSATLTQSETFESNISDKRALEGYAGAVVATVTPNFDRHIAAKNILEGNASSVAGAQMKATFGAGQAQLAALNEAGRLQALNEWGRAYGIGLAEAARLQALNEWGEAYGKALAGASGVVEQPTGMPNYTWADIRESVR
jgi:hypothetical protein